MENGNSSTGQNILIVSDAWEPQVIFLGKKNLMLNVFTSKNLEEICKYFLTQSVFSSIIRV